VTRRSRASERWTAAARREPTCLVGGAQRWDRHRGGGRRTGTDGRPTAVEESSTGEDIVGDPPAREGGSTEGGLLEDPPAREGGSTEGGLVGDPPAREGGPTEGGLVGDPPAREGGFTEGGVTAFLLVRRRHGTLFQSREGYPIRKTGRSGSTTNPDHRQTRSGQICISSASFESFRWRSTCDHPVAHQP